MNVWFYRTAAGNGIVFASDKFLAKCAATHATNGMDPHPGEVLEVLPTWEFGLTLHSLMTGTKCMKGARGYWTALPCPQD